MGTLISLTGPSASGKSTIERRLEEFHDYRRLISFTTRPMREGERNNVDYHFLTRHEAMKLIEAGEALQHVEFNDNLYGTLISDVKFLEAEGEKGVVVVEPNGVNNIREAMQRLELKFNFQANYIDCARVTLMRRHVERYIGDSSMSKESFASRWRSLLDDELKKWHSMAVYNNTHVNDSSDWTVREIASDIDNSIRFLT